VKNIFFSFFAVLFVALLLPGPSEAQTSEKTQETVGSSQSLPPGAASRNEIEQLFVAMDLHKQMEGYLQAFENSFLQSMEAQMTGITQKQKEELSKLSHQLFDKFMDKEGVDQLLEDMIAVYQRHLTQSDVKAIVAFYSSPAGKKLLHEQPLMVQESMPVVMASSQKRMEEIKKQMNFDERIRQIVSEKD